MAKRKQFRQQSKADLTLTRIVYDEYDRARIDQSDEDAEFEGIIDMLECKRTDKDYEWMSDVFLPEYPSIHLTEASQWANQYFQSRDFVEVILDSTSPEAVAKTKAAKKYLNTMLNVRELRHYPKYMRGRSINSTRGYVIAVCSWKQRLNKTTVQEQIPSTTGVDIEGLPVTEMKIQNKEISEPLEDRFEYDIIDPRNVFMDNKYVYTIQDKEWITIRSELSYEELKEREEENGYINLDILKEIASDYRTETSKATREKDDSEKQTKNFDVLERFGRAWAVVTEEDENGFPKKISTGYDDNGKVLDNAKYVESIITVAYSGNAKVLIRLQPTPFITSKGMPYRPIIRGLCYIHPTKDIGMSDGKYSKETQVLINDMVNMGIDRSKLSMMPTLKVRRLAWEDNDSIYFEPEHAMIVENHDDITEFRIDGNINPAMEIVSLGISKMQQTSSIYPTTMGELPNKASTTATAISGAQGNTNMRGNYKSLTYEYTFLCELYWMMLQMGYQFMHPQTAIKIMGDLAKVFSPEEDYTYKPVTSNIETETNKDKKIQRFDQMLGRIANIPNPAIVPIIATIIGRQFDLMGDEYQQYAAMIQKLAQTQNTPDKQENGNAPADAQGMPTQNQQGLPMQLEEQGVRESAGEGTI